MSDVFISYAREDNIQATALARVLEARGWSVWWDRSILPGTDFDQVIQQELSAAKCIVVLWSRHSVASRWVRAEAEEGANREILVPASIDDAAIPLGFRRIQVARLIDWDGTAMPPEESQLIERITGILGRPAPPVSDDSPAPATRRWRIPPLLLVSVPTILAVLVVGGLMLWRIPARVEVELTASRAQFTIGPARSQVVSVLGPIDVASLSVEKFAAITFEPQSLQIADPDAGGLDLAIPDAAWRSIAIQSPKVSLTAGEDRLHPAVTFESAAGPSATVGRLDAVRATPKSVVTVVSGGGERRLTVRIDGPKPAAVVAIPALFQIFADYAVLDANTKPPQQAGSVVYRARLRPESPFVEVTGAEDSLVLSLDLLRADGNSPPLFSDDDMPVSSMEFTELNDVGARVSAVRAEGHIGYPDHPDIQKIPIHPHDSVGLAKLGKFYLREITTDPTSRAMRFHLDGIAGQVMTGTGDIRTDHRITGFDALWHNPRLAVLIAIIVWVFPTTIGALRLYNDLKRQ